MSTLREVITYPKDYEARMAKYNHEAELLEIKRKEFYEANPNFPIKTMFMQVIAPPQKLELRIYEP
jgi:hypothetical protein